MYYSSIGMIALIVHFIVNIDLMKKVEKTSENTARLRYRHFLFVLIVYYCSDIAWGTLYEQQWIAATYIDTLLVFSTMVLSVLLWTRSVVAFTNDHGKFGKLIVEGGWIIFMFEMVILILNFFKPIVYYFDENNVYIPLPARHIALFMQMGLYLVTAVSALVIALRSGGEKRAHYRIIGFSSTIMAVFIALQSLFEFMPFYAIGCMFATCLTHSFVYKDAIIEHYQKIAKANEKAYTDALTGVKNRYAYIEALGDIERGLEDGTLEEYGIIVFDMIGLRNINSDKGHEAGDEYIKKGCDIICKSFKHSTVYRIGGDEFVAILNGIDYEHRIRLEKQFREMIDDNCKEDDIVIASGMAVYESASDENCNDVFKRADRRMNERKKALEEAIE